MWVEKSQNYVSFAPHSFSTRTVEHLVSATTTLLFTLRLDRDCVWRLKVWRFILKLFFQNVLGQHVEGVLDVDVIFSASFQKSNSMLPGNLMKDKKVICSKLLSKPLERRGELYLHQQQPLSYSGPLAWFRDGGQGAITDHTNTLGLTYKVL